MQLGEGAPLLQEAGLWVGMGGGGALTHLAVLIKEHILKQKFQSIHV